MKKIMGLLLLTASMAAQAELQMLDNSDLQKIEGQAGADISLKLDLNQDATGQYDQALCGGANAPYCRLALALNNRYVTKQAGDSDTVWSAPNSNSGRKLWLVLKDIQGSINIQKLGLDGVDLLYAKKGSAQVQILKPAIQLSLTASKPLIIKNFGFSALSIEQDQYQTSSDGSIAESNPTSASQYGYLNNSTYTSTDSVYDAGKQKGFTGMMMNGNLAINGRMLMFSCDSTHPRC